MKAADIRPSRRLQRRLMLAFAGFAFLLATLYGFYIVLFVYVVEDQFFNDLLAHEAQVQLEHRAGHGAWRPPPLHFMGVYEHPAAMPDALGERLEHEPWRREFPGDEGRHYHLLPLEPDDGAPAWLVAEVSQQLVVRPMRGGIAQWLGISGLGVVLAALLLGAWMARRMTRPLSRLAALVDRASPDQLPPAFARDFPDDEVGALAHGLERLIVRIEDFVAREREFTRDASHELRTPLAVIRSACERLALRGDLDQETRDQLAHVQQSALQLEHTVAMLLALAREPDSTEIDADVALLPLVERVVVEQAPLLQHADAVEIRVDVPASARARLPATVLHVVLSNLVGNAFAHTRQGPVVIDVADARLRITNPGDGVREADFQPFVKAEASAGFGLGLSIVRRLCERHGIVLRIQAEDGDTIASIGLSRTDPTPGPQTAP